MSGLEVLAVVACVAGVVSAFNDGSKIVRQIKDKRAARKAPPPTKFLEQSLDRAPKDIEAEKEHGVERFGQAFMIGDIPNASSRLQPPLEIPGPSAYQVHSPVQHSPQASLDWQAPDEEDLSQVWRTETQETQETQSTVSYAGMQRKPSVSTPQNSGLFLQSSPQSLLAPTADNNYLGFCKGAWKMQNGDKHAMKRLTEFNDGWSQSKVYYLACSSSKCAFAGRLPPEKANKVWISSSKGIRFRWVFLAKSHVPQQKVQKEQYVYQCMICAFQGRRSPNLAGTDTLLEHISGHRGEDLDKVVLYNTKCITGRIASDEEEFDINLEPPKDGDINRRDSFCPTSLVPDSDPRATSSLYGVPIPNEPWNEP
ncbi:hypothetical protein B0A49_03606 [Cryomyces minteri]|uniref:BED-type domain-containing protein n=1 Tax=Cryomyces minteri TaxID=331657 RepID=A0A4U0XER1_9PEZI|nr:hypothetical protein B0A49_03606 [Cryomyces minteri]